MRFFLENMNSSGTANENGKLKGFLRVNMGKQYNKIFFKASAIEKFVFNICLWKYIVITLLYLYTMISAMLDNGFGEYDSLH